MDNQEKSQSNSSRPFKRKSQRHINRVAKKRALNIANTVNTEIFLKNIEREVNEPMPTCSAISVQSPEYDDDQSSEGGNSHNGKFDERDEHVPFELIGEESNDVLSSVEDHGNSPFVSVKHGESDTFQASISSIPPSAYSENSKDFLCGWALQNNVTHTALTLLLKWLNRNPDLTNLPSDARTLLHTPSGNCLEQMGSGTFHYFGLRHGITRIFKKYRDNNMSYSLDFNIDGLPIHKSTKESFWPILCKVAEYSDEHPFPVAIYSGRVKPPLEYFFSKFVTELKIYLNDGLGFNDIVLNISCRYFCCDTPARSFIKNTKSHNAYKGCDKCEVEGHYLNHKMTFPNLRAHLRSDESFLLEEYGVYRKGPTPLSDLNIGMVSAFPNDYMHSICLGVCRKLLFLWRDGSRIYRFKLEKYNLLESKIVELKKYWPLEFNRKPRSLQDLEHWKATEFRQFLLYVSPLLHDILPRNIFCNLMLLKFGITILLNFELNAEYNEYAGALLKLFVKNSMNIYGKEFCIYNVHSVIHLADEAKLFGSLNDVNCFPFENYLSFLKRMLRKSNNNLQQVVNRVSEGKEMKMKSQNKNTYVVGKPCRFQGDDRLFFKKLHFENSVFSIKFGNNCAYLRNDKIILINSIFIMSEQTSNIIYISGKLLQIIKPMLDYPTDSSIIHLFEVALRTDDIPNEEVTFDVNEIKHKGILLKSGDIYIASPIIHCI